MIEAEKCKIECPLREILHEGDNIESDQDGKFLERHVPFVNILTKGKIELTRSGQREYMDVHSYKLMVNLSWVRNLVPPSVVSGAKVGHLVLD